MKPGDRLEGCSDDPLEPVEVHPVPRQEVPAVVLALLPPVTYRRCVDRRLVRPTGRVVGGALLHRTDRSRISLGGRMPRTVLFEGPNVPADQGSWHWNRP